MIFNIGNNSAETVFVLTQIFNYIKYQSLLRNYFKTRKIDFNRTSFVYYTSRQEAKCDNYHKKY